MKRCTTQQSCSTQQPTIFAAFKRPKVGAPEAEVPKPEAPKATAPKKEAPKTKKPKKEAPAKTKPKARPKRASHKRKAEAPTTEASEAESQKEDEGQSGEKEKDEGQKEEEGQSEQKEKDEGQKEEKEDEGQKEEKDEDEGQKEETQVETKVNPVVDADEDALLMEAIEMEAVVALDICALTQSPGEAAESSPLPPPESPPKVDDVPPATPAWMEDPGVQRGDS